MANIDDLLCDIEQSTGGKKLLTELDGLCSDIDAGLENRKREVTEWPTERKRQEAINASAPLVLTLLSRDENFNIHTLSTCIRKHHSED